ncbi:phospholipase [Actinoplanes sp. Pm04-4]|jgi:opacity protein-like surface antigen|uniref:Phospholipase n=1 Tax=Paractinoplanes pyxinae TaxID=2997416 RepID=A0ABT4AXK7_9ACTN|nr:phospholipase [Actinoplanes pyxinae]MCY1138979.1 phospholipase [Actinoplanes pyxinae]
MTRRILVVLLLAVAVLFPASSAYAADSKATVLARWTQPTAASTAAWNDARANRSPWASYNFDWSTDYCSSSPDNPLGFNFDLSCWHHDFGYRNYKAIGTFSANKARIDNTFYADLQRVCATYGTVSRAACNSLAWVYYQAVKNFGSLAAVKQSDIDRAAALMKN